MTHHVHVRPAISARAARAFASRTTPPLSAAASGSGAAESSGGADGSGSLWLGDHGKCWWSDVSMMVSDA